jgi:hypothetical protein
MMILGSTILQSNDVMGAGGLLLDLALTKFYQMNDWDVLRSILVVHQSATWHHRDSCFV